MSNNGKKPKRIQWDKITYVINNLTDKDLSLVDDMDVDLEHVDNFISRQIENGADFKVKFDYDYGDCQTVSMVFYNDGFDNSGYGVSARGRDFTHCIKIIMYKYFEVAQERLYELYEVKRSTRYG